MFKLLGILVVISLLALPPVGCSKPPLTLTISEPIDGATVTTSSLTVKGTVSDPKATVTVNNARTWPSLKYGVFSTKVTLAEGENIITVVATRGKEVITTTVTITYTR